MSNNKFPDHWPWRWRLTYRLCHWRFKVYTMLLWLAMKVKPTWFTADTKYPRS